MRAFFVIAAISVTIFLAGCSEKLNEARDSILDAANKTAEGIGYQYETTKSSLQQKADEIQDAAAKVKAAQESVVEAKDALQKITE